MVLVETSVLTRQVATALSDDVYHQLRVIYYDLLLGG
jgi:hypothetical protein